MSKKTLLNETQVRRFMKLATLGTLSDGFVSGLSEGGYFTEQEDEMGDEMGDEMPVDDMAMDVEGAAEMEMGDEEAALDDAAGESLPPDVISKVESALASALGAMEQSLEEAIPELDLSVEQTGDEMEMGDEEMGMDDELGDEMPGDEGPIDDMAAMGEEPGMGDEEIPAEDELVERIVRRVAQRLRKRKGNK